MSSPDKQKPTGEERALAKRGAREFNDYVKRYLPVEDKYLEKAKATDAVRQEQRGIANVEAALANKESRSTFGKATAKTGGAPSSGRSVLGTSGLSNAQGKGAGLGQDVADREVKDRELKSEMKMTAFGRGLADQSSTNLRSAGSRAQRAAARSQRQNIEDSHTLYSTASTVGGLVGKKLKERADEKKEEKLRSGISQAKNRMKSVSTF